MSNTPELAVGISAVTDKLEKGLDKAEKSLKGFENKTNTFNSKLGKSSATAAKGLDKLKKSTVSGSSAMTAFSRTVQDAPFGIMGVSNNITNLTEQFGYLKAKTGSSGSALKAMLKDLKGFGGISLGISVVTSLLLVFGDKLGVAKTIFDDFNESLGQMSSSSIVKFKILTDTILDVNTSQKEQAKALSILKEKYADFDSSILTTKGNYDKSRLAIEAYINTLVQQARAQAALKLIEEKQSKILELEEKKRLKIRKSYNSANEEQFEERRKSLIRLAKKQVGDLSKLSDEEAKNRKESLAKHIKDINSRFDAVKNTNSKEITQLENQISTLATLTNLKDLVLNGDSKKHKKTKTAKPVWIEEFKDNYDKGKQEILELVETDPLMIEAQAEWETINWTDYFNLKQLEKQQIKLQEKLEKLNLGVKNIISNSIASTFSDLGTAIGSGVGNIGQVLAAGLSGLLSSMGDYLIQVGTAAVLAGTLTALFGTELGIGAGIAAIAGGVALKAFSGAFGSSSDSSGSVSSDTSTYSGGSGSSYSGSSSGSGYGNVVFEIQGRTLVGVLSKELGRNKSLGGSLTI